MKKLLLFMFLCLFVGTGSFAYDAEIDGIYYEFWENEAYVTSDGL